MLKTENEKNLSHKRKFYEEYSIFIQNGTCPQYEATTRYKNWQQAYLKLLELVELEKERKRPYFVDYKDFENEYTKAISGKTFTIKAREYTEWKPVNSINNTKDEKERENAKIKYILNFR